MTQDAHIVLVMDRTGSMSSMWKEALEGLNSFIKEQAEEEGTAYITLIAFNSNSIETLYYAWDAKDIPEITDEDIWPAAMTPLYDAIGKGINEGRKWLGENDWFEGKKILVALTDGLENASNEWTLDRIKKEIERLQDDGWDVLYLAANQDAWAEGSKMGTQRGQTMTYGATGQSVAGAYSTASKSVTHARQTGARTQVPDKEEHLDDDSKQSTTSDKESK